MPPSKPYDVVIFGASGFAGRLVVQHFLKDEVSCQLHSTLRWAIAGRNHEKLKDMLNDFIESLPFMVSRERLAAIPILVADAHDKASLETLVQSTRVVVSTVNPFVLNGSLLVEACVEHGVHYCDLTGEMLWVERMIQDFQARAMETGAVLVPCCGFDAVVAGLTAFELSRTVEDTHNSKCSSIAFFLTGSRGGFSGGSFASAIAHVAEARSHQDGWHKINNPFLLCSDAEERWESARQRQQEGSWFPQRERDLDKNSSVFFGAVVNRPIVHRSNELLDGRYGDVDTFVYQHRMAVGGSLMQWVVTASMLSLGAMLYGKWTRAMLRAFGPKPGTGPAADAMQQGSFSATAFAYTAAGNLAARAQLAGPGDPGFWLTTQILAQCAQCLARIEELTPHRGFLTPASAFPHELTTALTSKHITENAWPLSSLYCLLTFVPKRHAI